MFLWYLWFSWRDPLSFPFCCFPLFLCIECWRRLFLSLLAILWNSAFRCLYLSFAFPLLSPLLFTSLLFTAICKASPDSHFAFLHFYSMGMVLIPVSCTMSRTSFHSSSGTLSIRSRPLNLFLTSTYNQLEYLFWFLQSLFFVFVFQWSVMVAYSTYDHCIYSFAHLQLKDYFDQWRKSSTWEKAVCYW